MCWRPLLSSKQLPRLARPINQLRLQRAVSNRRSAITLRYEIADRFFSVNCSEEDIAESAHEFLSILRATRSSKLNQAAHAEITLLTRSAEVPPDVALCFGTTEAGAEVSYYSDPHSYAVKLANSVVVARGGRDVIVSLSDDLDYRSFLFQRVLTHGFTAAMRRAGAFELHCAAVVEPGSSRAVLIVGPSGSGKSTLALQLASRGWRYSTDDVVLLTLSEIGVEAHGLRRHFAVTSETIDNSRLGNVESSSIKRTGIDEKFSVRPEDYFSTRQLRKCTPESLVFVTKRGEIASATSALSQAEAMQRLLGISPWVGMDLPTAPACVSVLGALARQCGAFELNVGRDLLGNERYTADLFGTMLNRTA